MLEGVNLTALEVKSFGGADIGPKYQPPEPPAPKEEELKLYHGNCHCGAFRFNVRVPELTAVGFCNCSHCVQV